MKMSFNKPTTIQEIKIMLTSKKSNLMKKLVLTVSAGLLISLVSMGQSTLGPGTMGSSLTIAGLPHNFSTAPWNTYNYTTTLGQQICQPCHTPHNGNSTIQLGQIAPLWNHQLSTATYSFYKTIKDNTTMGVTAIDGTSQLCLSCHDGTVALSAFGGQSATNYLTGGANLGGTVGGTVADLSNDHPVSINYANALAGQYGGLRATTYLYSTFDSASSTGYTATTKAVSTLLDAAGKVQCTSCHGAHSNSRGYQLKMSNRGSALCLACHSK
jgi:predicted CXXCH cytochrome family protein